MTEKQLPHVFIGSSVEGLDVAREVELQLHRETITTIWKDGVFGLGSGTLESLMNVLDEVDFAVIILSPDDMLKSRESSYVSPRDNAIFELGLFMGRLGRQRTFIVREDKTSLKLPSDLDGITLAPYRKRDNLSAGLSPTCTPIIKAIRRLGRIEGSPAKEGEQLLTQDVDQADFLNSPVCSSSQSSADIEIIHTDVSSSFELKRISAERTYRGQIYSEIGYGLKLRNIDSKSLKAEIGFQFFNALGNGIGVKPHNSSPKEVVQPGKEEDLGGCFSNIPNAKADQITKAKVTINAKPSD